MSAGAFDAAVRACVSAVPAGRVTTYGAVAAAIGRPRASRAVGYALRRLGPDSEVPWWRVVNAQGAISPRGGAEGPFAELQRLRLEREGVAFDAEGRLDLRRYAL